MLNRQSVTDNGVTSSYSANGLNQYGVIAGQALGYDSNFNVAAYNGGTYTYDSANYLISANNGSVQFTYDGLGRCVKRVINGVASLFVFDGWKPILEFDGAGNPQVWNIYGPGADEILLRITNSALLRYHADRQGNVAFILDASGYGTEKYTYDAFGKPTITDWSGNGRTTSAVGNRFMYTGREWIQELGIYDYRHRFYHPGLGRFLQTDPTGFDAGDMNLFRYCDDDPMDHSDPTGLLADRVYTGGFTWWDIGASPASRAASNNSQPAGVIMAQISADDEGGKAGGGQGATSGQNASATEGTHFVPTRLSKDGKIAYPTTSDHTGDHYEYQLKKDGKRVGPGYTVLEKLSLVPGVPNNTLPKIKQEKPRALQSNGIFPDDVGLGFRPSHSANKVSVVYQTFELKYNNQIVPISTRFIHDLHYDANGQLKVSVLVDRP
jgi:RHS repeat-associated protein